MVFFMAFLIAIVGGGSPTAGGAGGDGPAFARGAITVRPLASPGLSHAGRVSQDSTSGQPSLTGGDGSGGDGGTGGSAIRRRAQDSSTGQPS